MKNLNDGLCITCKHYKLLEKGYEFEGILDTEYMRFQCEIFGKESKEYYLMQPVEEDITVHDYPICEFWEFWDEEN